MTQALFGPGVLATSGPPSSAKNVMELYVMVEESARLGSAHVRKLVYVDWEEARKLWRGQVGLLGNVPRLSLLGSVPRAPRAPPSRGLPKDPTRRPGWGGGV
ncbi:hypothetical protein BHE74_00045408 [Ensete ventricosum]|nr:hypothetical protein BHE74_00045408 [Ensete ventricosum]